VGIKTDALRVEKRLMIGIVNLSYSVQMRSQYSRGLQTWVKPHSDPVLHKRDRGQYLEVFGHICELGGRLAR